MATTDYNDEQQGQPQRRTGELRKLTWRREAAKASWELLRRVLNWEQMLLASLAALRLSMASWATFLFHSEVMAGGLTNVILWMIWRGQHSESN